MLMESAILPPPSGRVAHAKGVGRTSPSETMNFSSDEPGGTLSGACRYTNCLPLNKIYRLGNRGPPHVAASIPVRNDGGSLPSPLPMVQFSSDSGPRSIFFERRL